MKELCKLLGVERIRTTVYHPQTNGVVERMHSSLTGMLNKAHNLGMDWAQQLPYALFALRQMPNRDTGLSPFELVYGRDVRTPLELVYGEWTGAKGKEMDVCSWVGQVQERLELVREAARSRKTEASRARKEAYDKKSCSRTFEVGDIVWNRLPGLDNKLAESWSGPWEVVGRLSAVNYGIKKLEERGKKKVVHINTLKACVEREGKVRRLTVVAEEEEEELPGCLSLKEVRTEYNQADIDKLLEEFSHVLRNEPGNTSSAELVIKLTDEVPVQLAPYRIPEKLKAGVKKEIDGLLEQDIIGHSASPYASPLVPLTKPDGSTRLCVDYRRLNEKTVSDPYYMGTLDEIVERVGQSSVLSKIDLAKGYYQVPVTAGSKEKTAFISPYDKYEFSRMPFGLKNASAIFQHMMDGVLNEVHDCAAPYIDDIVAFSENWDSHLRVCWVCRVSMG